MPPPPLQASQNRAPPPEEGEGRGQTQVPTVTASPPGTREPLKGWMTVFLLHPEHQSQGGPYTNVSKFIRGGLQSCRSPGWGMEGEDTRSFCRREAARSPHSWNRSSRNVCSPCQARATHRGIRDTAGEGHPALLAAVAGTTAVEVDIEVPVFRAICPTAQVLPSQKQRTIRVSQPRLWPPSRGCPSEMRPHVCLHPYHRETEAGPTDLPRRTEALRNVSGSPVQRNLRP